MRAEPNPVPTDAGDKFPVGFGGPGLGSGAACLEGSPGARCHPGAGKSHPQPLLSRGPGGHVGGVLALELAVQLWPL